MRVETSQCLYVLLPNKFNLCKTAENKLTCVFFTYNLTLPHCFFVFLKLQELVPPASRNNKSLLFSQIYERFGWKYFLTVSDAATLVAVNKTIYLELHLFDSSELTALNSGNYFLNIVFLRV